MFKQEKKSQNIFLCETLEFFQNRVILIVMYINNKYTLK